MHKGRCPNTHRRTVEPDGSRDRRGGVAGHGVVVADNVPARVGRLAFVRELADDGLDARADEGIERLAAALLGGAVGADAFGLGASLALGANGANHGNGGVRDHSDGRLSH